MQLRESRQSRYTSGLCFLGLWEPPGRSPKSLPERARMHRHVQEPLVRTWEVSQPLGGSRREMVGVIWKLGSPGACGRPDPEVRSLHIFSPMTFTFLLSQFILSKDLFLCASVSPECVCV